MLLSLYAVLLSSYSVLLPLYAVLLSLYSVLLSLGASLVIRWWFVGSFGQRFPDAGQQLHSFLLAFLPSWFCLTVIYIYLTNKPSFTDTMASSAPAMSNILKKLGLGHLFDKFESENITPDVVGLLSVSEMNSLGILERQDMMNLRIERSKHGVFVPVRSTSGDRCGAPQFDIHKEIIERHIEEGFKVQKLHLCCQSRKELKRKERKNHHQTTREAPRPCNSDCTAYNDKSTAL